MHVFFRQIDVPVAEIFRSVKLDLLIAHHLADDLHFTVLDNGSAFRVIVERVNYPYVGVSHSVGVIVGIHFSDVSLFALQIELVHMVLLRGQHVDGFVVHGGEGAVPVDFGNHAVIACIGGIDYHDVLRIDGSQADLVCRVAFRCPVPAVICPVQYAFFFQVLQKLLQIFAAEFFSFFKGQLKGRTFDVMQQDE